MQKLEQRIPLLGAALVLAALLATGNAAAQSANEPEQQQEQEQQEQEQQQAPPATQEQTPAEEGTTAPARPSVPQVTGMVTRWTGNRIDLKTAEGELQKVAVNQDTEQLVDIKTGIEVTVEYRRKISGFVIATRVLAAETEAEEDGAE